MVTPRGGRPAGRRACGNTRVSRLAIASIEREDAAQMVSIAVAACVAFAGEHVAHDRPRAARWIAASQRGSSSDSTRTRSSCAFDVLHGAPDVRAAGDRDDLRCIRSSSEGGSRPGRCVRPTFAWSRSSARSARASAGVARLRRPAPRSGTRSPRAGTGRPRPVDIDRRDHRADLGPHGEQALTLKPDERFADGRPARRRGAARTRFRTAWPGPQAACEDLAREAGIGGAGRPAAGGRGESGREDGAGMDRRLPH